MCAEKGQGCQLEGKWEGNAPNPSLKLRVTNSSASQLSDFMIQFNKNAMGLSPASQIVSFDTVAVGEKHCAHRLSSSSLSFLLASQQQVRAQGQIVSFGKVAVGEKHCIPPSSSPLFLAWVTATMLC